MGDLGKLGRILEEAMKRQAQVLPTENEAWGFYGTMSNAVADREGMGTAAMPDIWVTTSQSLLSSMPDMPPKAIREFLDSRGGRHFADAVVDELGEKPFTMRQLQRALATVLDGRDGAWVRKDVKQFAGQEPGAMQAGTMQGMTAIVEALNAAHAEVQAQERKKNWKERDAAMHKLMTAAEVLLGGCRAWFAQKR